MKNAPDALVRRMGLLRQHHLNVLYGKSLPTTKDLLRACPYIANDLRRDMQVFADIACRRVRADKVGAKELKKAFRNLTLEGAGLKDVLLTHRTLRKHGDNVLGPVASGAFQTRCELYAASLNHVPMLDKVWRKCFELAAGAETYIDAFLYLQAALGWNAVKQKHWRTEDLRDIGYAGEQTLEMSLAVWQTMTEHAQVKPAPQKPVEPEKPEATPDTPGHLTVLKAVGNADLMVGKRVAEEFKKILGAPLPLTRAENLQSVRHTLVREFPWASRVSRVILTDIEAHHWISFRPTILLGPPGCGKTRYCNRLLTLLGVKHRVYNAGGVSDSSFNGTARHWSNAEPSLPMSVVRAFQTANPGIVLDEIDKASESRTNGSLFDGLLAMTEPESAAGWYDPYIQAPVNLSGILWLGTANEAEDIPATLRDRFRILTFPEPEADHLEPLARTLMAELIAEQGLRAEWARPLSWEELDALWAVWDGGSVRALRRFLEGVLRAREAEASETVLN